MSATKTQAAVIVAALVAKVGASAMARRLGVTEGACRSHASGAVPRAGVRARYLELYDVPLVAWEVPAGSSIAPGGQGADAGAGRAARAARRPGAGLRQAGTRRARGVHEQLRRGGADARQCTYCDSQTYCPAQVATLKRWLDDPTPPQDAPAAVPTEPSATPQAASGAPAGAGPVDARTEVTELLAVARAQLEAAKADTTVPYRERAQLITAATGLVRLLARLSGALEVTEAALLRSRPWAEAMGIVRQVLERHPDAAAELNSALEAFAKGKRA